MDLPGFCGCVKIWTPTSTRATINATIAEMAVVLSPPSSSAPRCIIGIAPCPLMATGPVEGPSATSQLLVSDSKAKNKNKNKNRQQFQCRELTRRFWPHSLNRFGIFPRFFLFLFLLVSLFWWWSGWWMRCSTHGTCITSHHISLCKSSLSNTGRQSVRDMSSSPTTRVLVQYERPMKCRCQPAPVPGPILVPSSI